MDRLVCVNKNWAHVSERNVPKLKSGKTYEAIAKEMLRYIYCKDSLPEWLQVRTEPRWLLNVTVGWNRHYYNSKLQRQRVSHPSCTSLSYCCENIAHDPWNITNVPYHYDINLASHEAVALSLPEEYQTKSIQVPTMCTVFDIILRNPIKEDLPGCWRYLLSQSTLLGFLCFWAWPWYVNCALCSKE